MGTTLFASRSRERQGGCARGPGGERGKLSSVDEDSGSSREGRVVSSHNERERKVLSQPDHSSVASIVLQHLPHTRRVVAGFCNMGVVLVGFERSCCLARFLAVSPTKGPSHYQPLQSR